MEELLDPNAAVTHLLPTTLRGLITQELVYNILLESMEDLPMRKQLEGMEIERGITELSVDQDKSILLSMFLGNTFTKALDLVFNLDIMGSLSDVTIVPVVKRDTTQLLAKLGLSWKGDLLIRGSLQFIHRERGSPVHVDLANWYCECHEYQSRYCDDMNIIEFKGDPSLEQLLQDMKSQFLSPPPLCSHIIAILIVKYNEDKFNMDSL